MGLSLPSICPGSQGAHVKILFSSALVVKVLSDATDGNIRKAKKQLLKIHCVDGVPQTFTSLPMLVFVKLC